MNCSHRPDQDREFLEAMADVRKLDRSGLVHGTSRQRPVTPLGRPSVATESSVPPESFLAPGVHRDVLTELRSGRARIEATKDLHGLSWAAARVAIDRFIAEAQNKGCRVVCIVHGKGRQSAGGEPVLKPRVRSYLSGHRAVLAFGGAHPRQGGDGAVLVKLRK